MFASKNNPFDSALDGIGMGIGFTLALGVMGLIREFFGSGTLFGMEVLTGIVPGMGIFNLAPGGFFVFGVLIAAVNYLTKGKALKKKEFGCDGCAMAAMCGGARKQKDCEKGAEEVC